MFLFSELKIWLLKKHQFHRFHLLFNGIVRTEKNSLRVEMIQLK